MSTLRQTADQIISASIQAVLPDEAVRRALKDFRPEGRVFLVAARKSGMADGARRCFCAGFRGGRRRRHQIRPRERATSPVCAAMKPDTPCRMPTASPRPRKH